jgi:serine protease AprX
MRGGPGNLKQFIAVALAAAFVVSASDTAWTFRTASFRPNVDPSLRAGEVALVHTTAGHAGALSIKLAELGAVDIRTEDAADTIIARLTPAALDAVSRDATVTVATSDIAVVASGGGKDKPGYEESNDSDSRNEGRPNQTGNRTTADAFFSPSLLAIRGPLAWTRTTGAGVTVAIMDSGIAEHPDLRGKVKARLDFTHDGSTLADPGGHGTFIAGVIAANGAMKGVAPSADLVSLRVLDRNGNGTLSSVVGAFSWALKNQKRGHIDVLNISWGAPQATSYHKSLLSALVEAAWFSGMTVVVAAGNDGPAAGSITAPATDPFVVSVGSFGDHGTAATADDTYSIFSGRGPTFDGFAKPDILAPGEHVASLRAQGVTYLGADGTPIGSPSDLYIHMSGTSASAAFVSGVAALVASSHKRFTPTQTKGALLASTRPIAGSVAGAVDAPNALVRTSIANAGLKPSRLLLQMLAKANQLKVHGISWEGVSWDGVIWGGVSWDAISWEVVSWETVAWETVAWETVAWETVAWEGVSWEDLVIAQ